jgi:hypothetical protein
MKCDHGGLPPVWFSAWATTSAIRESWLISQPRA